MRRVREDSRGDDASEVVREVVRRVEAAVLGAVAPALPAGGTAGKEAQAPGAAAAYAAKGLYDQRSVSLCIRLACLLSAGRVAWAGHQSALKEGPRQL